MAKARAVTVFGKHIVSSSECSTYSTDVFQRAIILETHRVQALITARLIRVAPNDTLQFRQWAIPAGTPVSMSTHFTHRDPILFPEPMRFDPDRWFGAAKGMEKYVVPFSKGTRGCIGLQ